MTMGGEREGERERPKEQAILNFHNIFSLMMIDDLIKAPPRCSMPDCANSVNNVTRAAIIQTDSWSRIQMPRWHRTHTFTNPLSIICNY